MPRSERADLQREAVRARDCSQVERRTKLKAQALCVQHDARIGRVGGHRELHVDVASGRQQQEADVRVDEQVAASATTNEDFKAEAKAKAQVTVARSDMAATVRAMLADIAK